MRLTTSQEQFLTQLLIDCSLFDPRSQRLGYLTERCGRKINYLDEVSVGEATRIIKELIVKRDDLKDKRKKLDGQEELF